MPSSSSEGRSRVALLASMTLSLGACATAMDSGVPLSHNYVAEGGEEGNASAGGAGRANGGSGSIATGGSAGKSGGAAGGAVASAGSGTSGASNNGGAPSSGGAGKGGTGSVGTGSAGTSPIGGAGKGGTSSAGGGSGASAGKGGGGASAGSASAGSPSAGSPSTGGAPGSTTCDAAHALATINTSQVYTGKANDCVRLAVNPTWSTISLQFQPMPGTGPYPVPFSFFSCGGNGTGSLTADYMNVTFKTGANPGCDYFVQFEGGATTIKVTYYD